MTERFISVDIETSGPIVGRHSLLAIGACLCDDVSNTFAREAAPISSEARPEAMAIVGKTLDHFERHGSAPAEVFTALRDWIATVADGAKPVFVGFNAAFDWGFINWYFLTYAGENPFGVAPLDIKAYYAGFAGSSWEDTKSSHIPDRFKAIHEHTHDALDDAIEQALVFNAIRERAETRRISDEGGENDAPETLALHARLENLRRKADLQSSAHSVFRDRYESWNFVLTLASLIPTAALLCLVLVSDDFVHRAMGVTPDHFKLFTAGVALFAFVCVLVHLAWKPDSRAAAHARAVEHYANTRYDAGLLLDATAILDAASVKLVVDKYLDVRGMPPIPDSQFNRLKQRHLRKVDLSKRLDKDPWMRLPWFWARPK